MVRAVPTSSSQQAAHDTSSQQRCTRFHAAWTHTHRLWCEQPPQLSTVSRVLISPDISSAPTLCSVCSSCSICSVCSVCSVCSSCSICSVCSVVQDRSRRDTRRDILVVIYTSGRAQTSSYFSDVVAGACVCSVDNVCKQCRPVAMKTWEGYAGWWVGLPRIVGTRVLKYDQKLPPSLAPPRTDAPTNSCQRKFSRRVRSIK